MIKALCTSYGLPRIVNHRVLRKQFAYSFSSTFVPDFFEPKLSQFFIRFRHSSSFLIGAGAARINWISCSSILTNLARLNVGRHASDITAPQPCDSPAENTGPGSPAAHRCRPLLSVL